jgi:cell division protein FtsB
MSHQGFTFFRSFLRHRAVLAVNLLLLVFLSVSFGRELWRNRQVQKSIAELERQSQALEARNVEIARINTELESETFLEREARLRLGLVRPGERVFILDGPAPQATAATIGTVDDRDTEEEPIAEGNLKRWYWYFFHTESFDHLKRLERANL